MRKLGMAAVIVLLGGLRALGAGWAAPGSGEADPPIRNWEAPPFWRQAEAAPGREALAGRTALAGGPAALPFIALPPCRVIDTRGNAPLTGGFLPAATVRSYTVTSVCGIPAGAQALSLNATVVRPTGSGFLVLYPQGGTFPPVSTLNFLGNDVIVNAAVVPISVSGGISMALGVSGGDVILDVNGYYAPTPAVTGLNTLTGDVTLAAGTNVTLTPSGNTLTIATTGGSGGPPTGAAGGSLSGTYPNPGIADGAVTDAKIAGVSFGKVTGVPGYVLKAGDTMSGTLTLSTGNIDLVTSPSTATSGSILKNGIPFLHNAGSANMFGGFGAGNFTLTGVGNTAFGKDSLRFLSTGSVNTAVGNLALGQNSTGGFNTAVGNQVLSSNTQGSYNAALGNGGLAANTLGEYGTAVGFSSCASNTTSGWNTAIGAFALSMQSFANGGVPWQSENTAVGYYSLRSNQPTGTSNGIRNTAVGAQSLLGNTTGFQNTAIGHSAGSRFFSGIGYGGGAVTYVTNTTGSFNTFVGYGAGALAADVANCTAVGIDAYCDANDQVRLGNFFVSSIGGKVGWSALSDARAKEDIRDLEGGLDLVLKLRPVSYRLKGGNGRTDLGFLAQDVEALLGGDFGVVTAGGDPDRTLSLRYQDFIAPLVKAVQEQQREIAESRRESAALRAALEELRSEISRLRNSMREAR